MEGGKSKDSINVEGGFLFCGGRNFSKSVSVGPTFIREIRVAILRNSTVLLMWYHSYEKMSILQYFKQPMRLKRLFSLVDMISGYPLIPNGSEMSNCNFHDVS